MIPITFQQFKEMDNTTVQQNTKNQPVVMLECAYQILKTGDVSLDLFQKCQTVVRELEHQTGVFGFRTSLVETAGLTEKNLKHLEKIKRIVKNIAIVSSSKVISKSHFQEFIKKAKDVDDLIRVVSLTGGRTSSAFIRLLEHPYIQSFIEPEKLNEIQTLYQAISTQVGPGGQDLSKEELDLVKKQFFQQLLSCLNDVRQELPGMSKIYHKLATTISIANWIEEVTRDYGLTASQLRDLTDDGLHAMYHQLTHSETLSYANFRRFEIDSSKTTQAERREWNREFRDRRKKEVFIGRPHNDRENADRELSTHHESSLVSSPKTQTPYVVCETPTPSKAAQFWSDVFDGQLNIIVCLREGAEFTHYDVEVGARTSLDYWPTEVNSSIQYGEVAVTLREENDHVVVTANGNEIVTTRVFEIEKEGRIQTVNQVHIRVFEDHGLVDTNTLIKSLQLVDELEQMRRFQHTPIVVHCMGGTGRAGLWTLMHDHFTHLRMQRDVGKLEDETINLLNAWISVSFERELVQGPHQLVKIYDVMRGLLRADFNLTQTTIAPSFTDPVEVYPRDVTLLDMATTILYPWGLCELPHPPRTKEELQSLLLPAVRDLHLLFDQMSDTTLISFFRKIKKIDSRNKNNNVLKPILQHLLNAKLPIEFIESNWATLEMPERYKAWGLKKLLLSGQEGVIKAILTDAVIADLQGQLEEAADPSKYYMDTGLPIEFIASKWNTLEMPELHKRWGLKKMIASEQTDAIWKILTPETIAALKEQYKHELASQAAAPSHPSSSSHASSSYAASSTEKVSKSRKFHKTNGKTTHKKKKDKAKGRRKVAKMQNHPSSPGSSLG